MAVTQRKYDGLEIAVIGISGQFPGSEDHRQYWENLLAGKELLKTFTDEELIRTGVSAEAVRDPHYVKTVGILEHKDRFDRGFFNYSVEEVNFMDPQIRIYHEHCWKALEDGGYAAQTEQKKIGICSAASVNDTWKAHTYQKAAAAGMDPLYLNMLASQHFISSLVAYKLNLRGAAYYVDTACSSSLVAVHMACRSLLTRECDMVLAGGVSLKSQQQKGYYYKEGMIRSVDGHCRTFDAAASGTASGEGVGVVLLKRLTEAIKDKDHIYAIIKGSATNNDGSQKVGFTAPSVQGQADCIRKALKVAQVDPAGITYIEAHGTATRLGDPIEIRALNEAFATGSSNKFCAIGSVKTSIGHLDAAAGVAGLIKTVLTLKYRKIPASLHFRSANPEIDFDGGPFYVNDTLKDWLPLGNDLLRAGVSSFGMGGTNAHVVLEEAPLKEEIRAAEAYHLVTFSAKTAAALDRYITVMGRFLEKNQDIDPAEMAYTLQTGRRHFSYRRSFVVPDVPSLLSRLKEEGIGAEIKSYEAAGSLVFLLPGQGTQYEHMAGGLYKEQPVFREYMDKGFEIISRLNGENYRDVLYPVSPGTGQIDQTRYTQPLVFLVEYALAQLMLSMGIKYDYMIGHSIGEYVCACLDGIFSFEDALRLVVRRGALMDALPAGAMLSAALNEQDASTYLSDGISMAAVNSPGQIVFSGNEEAITGLSAALDLAGVAHVRLHTSHAFHSHMMDPAADAFREELVAVTFNQAIQPRFISNVHGRLIRIEEACSPEYWVRHMRECVRFAEGLQALAAIKDNLTFVEVGAGRALTNLLKQVSGSGRRFQAVNLLRAAKENERDGKYLLSRIGKLWEAGIAVDWSGLHPHGARYKVSLPVYCFEPVTYISEVPMPGIDPLKNLAVIPASSLRVDEEAELSGLSETEKRIERPALNNRYVSPVTETEKIIAGLLEQFFGMEQIGIEDNFFDLGGDSLKAMVLLREIKATFKLTIEIRELFNCKDVKQIAAEIDERLWINRQSEKQFTTII